MGAEQLLLQPEALRPDTDGHTAQAHLSAEVAAAAGRCCVRADYHPDKHERMKAVFKYYLDKDEGALKPFPGGSEPGT